MSADNYYVVLPHPDGGFAPVMGFASDEQEPQIRDGAPSYATPVEALAAVADEYAEYGHSISPQCYTEPKPEPPSPGEDTVVVLPATPVLVVPAYLDEDAGPEDDLTAFLGG